MADDLSQLQEVVPLNPPVHYAHVVTRLQALKALWEPTTHPTVKLQAMEGKRICSRLLTMK
jgi:hypothetical protein